MPRVLSESDVADFRERLCEVAEKLFAEKGPDAVTMRQLAAELGVSPMTPYRYFADKEDILAAVRTNGFNRFAEALETAERDIEYAEGVFSVAGTDRRIGLFELAARQSERQVFMDSTSAVQAPSWPSFSSMHS